MMASYRKGISRGSVGPILILGVFGFIVLTECYADAKKSTSSAEGVPADLHDYTEDLGSGVELAMIALPRGAFEMGNNSPNAPVDEKPAHLVELDPFMMGRTEVTVGQFRRFIDESGYRTDAEKQGWAFAVYGNNGWEKRNGVSWRNPPFEQTDNHPAACVSWNDATAFCKWLSAKSGKRYTLPTEAQWEYASRAGTTEPYFFGKSKNKLRDFAWHDKKLKGTTHPVATKQPNPFGLYDMGGNLWEWCLDYYSNDYYARSPRKNPNCAKGKLRMMRGGSWACPPRQCRSAGGRDAGAVPAEAHITNGFRVVWVLTETTVASAQ